MKLNSIFTTKSVFILFSIFSYIRSLCSIQQNCSAYDPKCRPTAANFTEPFIIDSPNFICPEFKGKPACCSDTQNILMKNNFDSLDGLFGSKYGGCDVCAVNLKRFWCHFTCNPNQSDFGMKFIYF